MITTKYTQFNQWIDRCFDYNFNIGDIQCDENQYVFLEKYIVAYWDRELNIGYICDYEFECI